MTDKAFFEAVERTIRSAMEREYRRGYQEGIRDAANFAGTWDKQISGTPFKFEDLILLKFNLIGRRKPRRKIPRHRSVREAREATKARLLDS